MRLAYAFLAEAAEMINGRFFAFGGGIEEIACPELPTIVLSLAIVAKIQVEEEEIAAVHTLKLSSKDPEGNSFIPEVSQPIGPAQQHGSSDKPVFHLIVSNVRGILVRTPGPHVISIFMNDVELSTVSFYVTPISGLQDEPIRGTEEGVQK